MNLDKSNAFMIRNDGTIFNVTVHPYGNEDVNFVEETLAASEWLYNHTKSNNTKELVMSFIKTWALSLEYSFEPTIMGKIIVEIKNKPYKFLTLNFVELHREELENANVFDNLPVINKLVCMELNQEFLRARYGGMYNTVVGSREMVFRVSSMGFNWFNIIWNFVENNKSKIDYVTVCADEESTGREGYYYNHNGTIFYRLPVNEFITIAGNPIVEKFKKIASNKSNLKLSNGRTLTESYTTKNYGNIVFNNQMKRDKELLNHYTQIMND